MNGWNRLEVILHYFSIDSSLSAAPSFEDDLKVLAFYTKQTGFEDFCQQFRADVRPALQCLCGMDPGLFQRFCAQVRDLEPVVRACCHFHNACKRLSLALWCSRKPSELIILSKTSNHLVSNADHALNSVRCPYDTLLLSACSSTTTMKSPPRRRQSSPLLSGQGLAELKHSHACVLQKLLALQWCHPQVWPRCMNDVLIS
eukprot:s7174_g2.t1